MSGHSKWANVKHRKAAQDSKRSKLFQKLAKEIMVAIKEKGNDPEKNLRLKLAIDKAKTNNMPSENINRLLQKNQKENTILQEIRYEGYAPNGVAIIIDCLTDNIKRTAAQVRAVFNKIGGNLGTNGSVSYLFEKVGLIALSDKDYDYDQLIELLLEMEILDLFKEEDAFLIKVKPQNFLEIKEFLISKKIDDFLFAEITEYPKQKLNIDDKEKIAKIEKIINALENLDDVHNVFTNLA